MADICMCQDTKCSRYKECYRVWAPKTGYSDSKGNFIERQSYFAGTPRKGDNCEHYWPMKKENVHEEIHANRDTSTIM